MAKKINFTNSELDLFINASRNIYEFAKLAYVVHPVMGRVQFDLYPFQYRVLFEFLNNRFTVVLKSRQMGLTELIALFVLWLAMFTPYQNIQMISLKDRVAKRLLRRIKFIYRNLPPVLQVPIINGKPNQFGCVTKDTVLVGDKEDFEIGTITPNEVGIKDVSHLGIKVLTHRGTFEKVLKTVNKGFLLTLHLEDNRGSKIRCTPDHKFLTPDGWVSAKKVLEKGLYVITWDSSYLDGIEPVKTKPITKEEIKETKYLGYFVSNTGKVFTNKKTSSRETIPLKQMKTRFLKGERVKFRDNGKAKQISVHRLVWETFMGPIPEKLVIDHIDGNRNNNHLTNLQCITYSENTKRAFDHTRAMVQLNYRYKIGIQKIGKILVLDKEIESGYGSGTIISEAVGIPIRDVNRFRNKSAGANTSVSKLSLKSISIQEIVDLEVENHHSYVTKSGFISHNTDSEMLFSNGSSIVSVPTTQDAVRSEPVSLLVMDEAAIMNYAETIWAAALPSLSTGGRAIVNSTPYGASGFFFNTYSEALFNANGFKPLKISWDLHPDRDQEWYKVMRNALGSKRTAQEIDCDFLASGDTVFDLADIRDIEASLIFNPPIEKRMGGNLLIFSRFQVGEVCSIGADISTGRAKDYSTFSVVNQYGVQKAAFKGRIPVNKMRDLLASIGREYGDALIAPESNGVGEAVSAGLQEIGYPNLYYTVKILKESRTSEPEVKKVPGWYTTSQNRELIINMLEQDVSEGNCEIYNPFFASEAYSFVYDDLNRPVAMHKGEYIGEGVETYTDDSVIAEAIANYIRKKNTRTLEIVNPR